MMKYAEKYLYCIHVCWVFLDLYLTVTYLFKTVQSLPGILAQELWGETWLKQWRNKDLKEVASWAEQILHYIDMM